MALDAFLNFETQGPHFIIPSRIAFILVALVHIIKNYAMPGG